MSKERRSGAALLLLWGIFLGAAAYAHFVWHWPIVRVAMATLLAFFLLLGGLLVIMPLVNEIDRRKRSRQIAKTARDLNLRFYPGPFRRDLLPTTVWDSELFRSTDNDVRNLLHGVTSTEDVKIFDAYLSVLLPDTSHSYERSRRTQKLCDISQTVACVTSSAFQLPRLVFCPLVDEDAAPGVTSKVSPLVWQDWGHHQKTGRLVEVTSSAMLSSPNRLRSVDPGAAGDLFHDEVISLLESLPDAVVYGEGNSFLLFREGVLADAEGTKRLLNVGLRLATYLAASQS